MEQSPNPFYEREGNAKESLPPTESPERLRPGPEMATPRPETAGSSKSFEDLVHEALEEELKYERDPELRHNAAERADEILAEFAAAKNQFEPEPTHQRTQSKRDKLPAELAQHLGVKNSGHRAASKQSVNFSSSNLGMADLVLSVIIAVLLIIVILILVL